MVRYRITTRHGHARWESFINAKLEFLGVFIFISLSGLLLIPYLSSNLIILLHFDLHLSHLYFSFFFVIFYPLFPQPPTTE